MPDPLSDVVVRPEAPADAPVVAEVVAAAFGRSDEADLVERIRTSVYFVPELALVAEVRGVVVGHVLLSRVALEGPSGPPRTVLALAPLAVRPDHQDRGIGTKLVELGLSRAEVAGEALVVVLGAPGYYGRFGFEPAGALGIEGPFDAPAEHFMVRLLHGDDGSHRGRVRYPPAFEAVR